MPLDHDDAEYCAGVRVETYQQRLERIMRQIEQRQAERPHELTGKMEWPDSEGGDAIQ